MNQELPRVSLQKLKQLIRGAVGIADQAEAAAVGELRKVLDIAIRDVYRRNIRDPRTEPLQNLIGPLTRTGYLPASVSDCASLVKDIGNVGVHSAEKTITEADFVSALQNLLTVLRWYEQEHQQIATGESADRSEVIDQVFDKEGQYAGKVVVLAGTEPGSDIEDEWDAIRKVLINDGVAVVSQDIFEREHLKLENVFFVQLFSTLGRLDHARLLFEKCGLADGSNRILQWRKTLPNPRIDGQILKSFDEEDRRFCEGARSGLFEEFKLALRDKLREMANPSDQIIENVKPYLYIAADRSNKADYDYAGKLQEAASKYADADVMRHGREGEQKKDFKDALKSAAGIVFLYGDTQPEFIEGWLSFYKREKQLFYLQMKRKLRVKLAALYEAPPQEENRKQVKPLKGIAEDELLTFGSREAFTLNDVPAICGRLFR
jgi:hypothetical protein